MSPRPIGYRATFIPLTQYVSQKEKYFYQAAKIIVETKEFGEYDNYIFAYSLTELMRRIYVNTSKIGDVFSSKAGVVTGNDDYFLRLWYEINISDFNTIAVDLNNKYVPYSKGGTFVKWYGNVIYALKLMDLYNDALVNQSVRRGDREA